MIFYREAVELIRSAATPLSTENVIPEQALGRVSAAAIFSTEALPPFTNSAMDGFAVRARDTKTAPTPLRFKVNGIIAAGDVLNETIKTDIGEAWEIMTGAPIPSDCDAVIKVEETERQGDWVQLPRIVTSGENVRNAGADFKPEEIIINAGKRIFPEHLMAFAALGVEQISVVRRPEVGVISTGAELAVDPRTSRGKIRNSTAPYLMAELAGLGISPRFLGTIADEPNEFLKLMKTELGKKVDVILSTGAVSMGRFDFVASAIRDLGAEILFHNVAIRPGKPLLFAKIDQTAFFGVPGNPVSTSVGLRFFVEPYLRKLQGLAPEAAMRARVETDAGKPAGFRCFFKAATSYEPRMRSTRILEGQKSFRIAPLLDANSWAILPEDGNHVREGTEIEVFPIHSWLHKEETR